MSDEAGEGPQGPGRYMDAFHDECENLVKAIDDGHPHEVIMAWVHLIRETLQDIQDASDALVPGPSPMPLLFLGVSSRFM